MSILKTLLPILALAWLLDSCTTESNTIPFDQAFASSTDTLRFDTVFTKAGSTTQTLKLFNYSDQPLRIESIKLGGGAQSAYRINVDGISGPTTDAINIPANDSIYIFVSVLIDPNNKQTPFLVSDSINIVHAQQTKQIQLRAYGQNAIYLKNEQIKTNTTWNAGLPFVIEGSLWIQEGATLTINKGCRIHMNASAPIIVDGTLKALGTKKDSIVFQGDRIDKDYSILPGSWPGIYFRNPSKNNSLQYTIVKNAYQGLIVGKMNGSSTKLILDQTIIDNCYETGLITNGSSIQMTNCLISNCGSNIILTGGGQYDFNHCTIVGFSTPYIQHKKPVLYFSNWDSTSAITAYETKAIFRNSVFWGEANTIDDEIQLSKKANSLFDVRIENCLYKSKSTLDNVQLAQNLVNQSPVFDSVDAKGSYFDFHINKGRSPLINKGKATSILIDLDGWARDNLPDIGCYEKQ